MGQLLRYSGMTTKIRAMKSKLVTPAGYQQLSEMSDVRDFVLFLKSHPGYKEPFLIVDETDLHRGEIEKLITRSLFEDFTKIYGFASLQQRKFLKVYYKRYEIDLLKYLFRLKYNHDSQPFYISTRRDFFERFSDLHIDKLLQADSTDELVDNLKDTEYYSSLSKIGHTSQPTLFDYEITLDLYHFSLLWKEKNRLLNGKELETITREYGSHIDLLNIQWIYRAKKYYHLSPSEIFALSIPIHYKLKKHEFIKLTESEHLYDYFEILRKTYYGTKYSCLLQNGIDPGYSLESTYLTILDKLFQANAKKDPYSLASVTTYLYNKEQEIDSLTTVLECIRYGLPSAETLRYIGGNYK